MSLNDTDERAAVISRGRRVDDSNSHCSGAGGEVTRKSPTLRLLSHSDAPISRSYASPHGGGCGWTGARCGSPAGTRLMSDLACCSCARAVGRIIAAVLLVLVCAAPASAANQRNTRPVALHPKWHVVAREVSDGAGASPALFTNGRYVFAWTGPGFVEPRFLPGPSFGRLIDDRTGSQIVLSTPSGCWPVTMSRDWLGFSCESSTNEYSAELYGLGDRQWQTVLPSQVLSNECSYAGQCSINLAGAGRYWVQWNWAFGCTEHCGGPNGAFQSLQTSQLQPLLGWQPGGTVIPDLDSPTLAQRLCEPLRVPTGPGVLDLYGRFAIDPSADYLERCGSHRRFRIDGYGPVANLAAVVWQAAAHEGELQGRFLPSLRTFSMPTPVSSIYEPQLVLAERRLYVRDNQGRFWASVAPKLPRRHRLVRSAHASRGSH